MSHYPRFRDAAERFRDRSQAGEKLADAIAAEIARSDAEIATLPKVVYALPRGGIPVAVPIARQLGCPLEIIVAKKITLPSNPELAIGAVTASQEVLWSSAQTSETPASLREAEAAALAAAKSQEALLLPYCAQTPAQGALAILIDDGIATGLTIAVAIKAIKLQKTNCVWIGAPVAPPELIFWLNRWADKAIILMTPQPFFSVSRFYQAFPQVDTTEAIALLDRHNQP